METQGNRERFTRLQKQLGMWAHALAELDRKDPWAVMLIPTLLTALLLLSNGVHDRPSSIEYGPLLEPQISTQRFVVPDLSDVLTSRESSSLYHGSVLEYDVPHQD